MGRVLCKMLLPQKEEHLPHIAVRAVKYYGISGGGFFSVFMVAALEHFPDVLGLHSEWLHSPSAFHREGCVSGETFRSLLPSFFAHPSLFASLLGLKESSLNLQGTCQDDQDREEEVINRKGGKRNSGFSKGALIFLCRSMSSKALFFPVSTGSSPKAMVVFNPSSG